jgi:hypothetical protein
MRPTVPVDLVVNCYERTYRRVLAEGFFDAIADQNRVEFAGRYAVINNVVDTADARAMAERLVASGEIDGFVFVHERIDAALRQTGLRRRQLGARPYFVDYALVMAITGTSPFVLGWDAEVELDRPADWITPALGLLDGRPDVFSAAPRWPSRGFDTLDEESISIDAPWRMTWSFGDQMWLARRAELASPIYRRFAPATLARTPLHPFSFEARIESYQRSRRRFRDVHEGVRYHHNDLEGVIHRLGGPTPAERTSAVLSRGTRRILHAVKSQHPSLRLP